MFNRVTLTLSKGVYIVMAKSNKAGTTATVEVGTAPSSQFTRISVDSTAVSSLLRAMGAKGFTKLQCAAIMHACGVPVSAATVDTQVGAAAGFKPGEQTNGHGEVPDYDRLNATTKAAIEQAARGVVSEGTDMMKQRRSQLKGKGRRDHTALPSFMTAS